jgi:hypothetical protein
MDEESLDDELSAQHLLGMKSAGPNLFGVDRWSFSLDSASWMPTR